MYRRRQKSMDGHYNGVVCRRHPSASFICVDSLVKILPLSLFIILLFPESTAPTLYWQVFQSQQSCLYSVLILDLHFIDQVQPALHQLHWLPVDRRISYRLSSMMFAVHTVYDCTCSVGRHYLFKPCLWSADTATNKRPRCYTSLGELCGPTCWNSLPSSLHQICDIRHAIQVELQRRMGVTGVS